MTVAAIRLVVVEGAIVEGAIAEGAIAEDVNIVVFGIRINPQAKLCIGQ